MPWLVRCYYKHHLPGQHSPCFDRCNWPLLYGLNLSDNDLDDAAMPQLYQGQWPVLQGLSLQHSKITALGIEFLTHGNWPFFNTLVLDMTALSSDTFAVLSLIADLMPEPARVGELEYVAGNRQEIGAAAGQAVLLPDNN